jgi:tripartite-type tricarboxylate transporter receptor subunit TctC
MLALAGGLAATAARAWEPTQPVELVVPAGTGGGADQMARFIQKAVNDHKLMRQPIQVVNKSGNSGVDGLLYMKAGKGDPHRLVITLSTVHHPYGLISTGATSRPQMLALTSSCCG